MTNKQYQRELAAQRARDAEKARRKADATAAWAASTLTAVERRERLRAAQEDCPACCPEEADLVADKDLDAWLVSHGVKP